MTRNWTRRAAAGLLAGACALLAACGSGSVVSDLDPQRFLVVGDGFADVGQNGHRYTVNDGSLNWVQQLASYYNLSIAPASAGGWGYAQGNARVDSADTTSGTHAPSVREQVDTLLARTTLDAHGDVVFINGGMSDIVAAVQATGLSDATNQAVTAAAQALAAQVHRLVQAGGRHVVVTGVYLLGQTPWARGQGIEDGVNQLSILFNTQLLLGIRTLTDNTVQYFDAAAFYDRINVRPQDYPFDNRTTPACTTPDASTCTPATVVAPNYDRYQFADALYFTPAAQRLFVDRDYPENVYTVFRNRW